MIIKKYVNMNMKCHNHHAQIQTGETECPDPLKNHKNIGFFSTIGPDLLTNQASIQCWATIGPPAKRYFNGVSLAGR